MGWHLKSEMHAGPWAGELAGNRKTRNAYSRTVFTPDGAASRRTTEKPAVKRGDGQRRGVTVPLFLFFCELSKRQKFAVDTLYNKRYNNIVNVSDMPVKGRLFPGFFWSLL